MYVRLCLLSICLSIIIVTDIVRIVLARIYQKTRPGAKALVARTSELPPYTHTHTHTCKLSAYISICNQISLLFHLFLLILTCSCPYSYNFMLTATYMCRPTGARCVRIFFTIEYNKGKNSLACIFLSVSTSRKPSNYPFQRDPNC